MRKKVVPRALLGACTENLPSELVLLAALHHSLAVLPALFPPPHLTFNCYHLTSDIWMLPSDIWHLNGTIWHLNDQPATPSSPSQSVPSHCWGTSGLGLRLVCSCIPPPPYPVKRNFLTTRKTRKSLVCSKPEQAYLSWSSLSRRWTSPVASRPLLRLVSTSPPACNKLSFSWIFLLLKKFTHSLGLFLEKFTHSFGFFSWKSLLLESDDCEVPVCLGLLIFWMDKQLGDLRPLEPVQTSNVRHFFTHLGFVVAVAIVFVGLVVANQIAFFVSVHPQNDLQNLLQNRKNCIFWCTKQIVMYPPKNGDPPKMPLFEPHQSSVPLWGRVAFLSSFLRNWHPPGRSYCLLLFIILQIPPGFCRARPTMDAMVTRYL